MAEKKINGRTFRTEPLLATEALILQARLIKLVGPALGQLGAIFAGRGEQASEEAKAQSNFAALGALASIFAQAQPQEVASLVKDLIEATQIKRASGAYDQADFDGDFTGHQSDIIPVVLFVLREQFGDFFTGLPGFGSLGKAEAA